VKLVLVAALTENRVIGRKGRLPWHLPEDLRRFRELTFGHAVLMGRKTFESIGKPLPGRLNIVLTRRGGYSAPGIETAASLPQALKIASAMPGPLYVIGGAEVYRLCLPHACALHLSLIPRDVPGDAFFPAWSKEDFREVSREQVEGEQPFEILILERTAPPEPIAP